MAFLPVNYWPETKGSFESALCALALVVICLYFGATWRRDRFTIREACVGGALAGIALLISPSVLPVIGLALLAGLWLFRNKVRVYLMYGCLFAIIAAAILMPWGLRNKRVLGSFIFTRSNLGLELAISNSDFSHVDHDANFADTRVHRIHPFVDLNARAEEARLGEVAFERERKNEAISWIKSHPGQFLKLTAARFVLFWFPHMLRTSQTVLIRLEALAGIFGFVLLWRTANRSKWIFGALWLGFPLIYYCVQAFARYRYPVDWSSVFLGSYAVHQVLLSRNKYRSATA